MNAEVDPLITATNRSWRTSEFFEYLPSKALNDFDSIATHSSCLSNTLLFEEHQNPSNICIAYECRVKLFTNSNDSRRFILRIARPGEILGLSSVITGNPYPMTAETLYQCTVGSVSRPDFLDFLNRYPEAYKAVACELSLQQDEACARLRTIGLTRCTSAKIGRLLLEWCANGRKTVHGTRVHLALTHEEIAECIGASRETVTRVLSDFRRRRIVDVRGAILTVMDREALEICSDL